MIPKIIHYCWFGNGLMPAAQKDCIKSWRRTMPDYEIKRWDETNFDVESIPYVKNAYQNKKYAFVSDYARLCALYTEGGFYMDTDVEVFSSFDKFRKYNLVSGIEYYPEFEEYADLLNENKTPKNPNQYIPYLGFLSAMIGAQKDNWLINDVLEFYQQLTPDSSAWNGIVIDGLIAHKALKYNFVYEDKEQLLKDNMLILPSDVFCCLKSKVNDKSVLLHYTAQSWTPKTKKEKLHIQLDKLHLLKWYKKAAKIKRNICRKKS